MEGAETDFDIGEGGEGGATGILSIRSIGAFFTGFGWTGAAAIQNGLGTGTATFAATIVGGIFLGLVVYLMSYLHSLRRRHIELQELYRGNRNRLSSNTTQPKGNGSN